MASVIIIPIVIVAIVGLSGYLVYRFLLYDMMCKRSVNKTLQKYNIKKTPAQIIKEYYTITKEKKYLIKKLKFLRKTIGKMSLNSFL